jgi:Peptidase family S41
VDLRGIPGGLVDSLEYFMGMFFDHDMKLFGQVQHKKTSPEVAKRGPYFPGKVIVLVNRESASAAEIFARVIQLEKRHRDRRPHFRQSDGSNWLLLRKPGVDYGAHVTANLIMTDGMSPRTPRDNPGRDTFPQPLDLASGGDPVLSRGAQEFGVALSPEAGKLFPYAWPKE